MPSLPPETGDDTLRELRQHYDQAYEALAQGDLDRVNALVERTGLLLASLGDVSTGGSSRDEAMAALGRLQAATQKLKDATRDELSQVRVGRKVLHGYAHHQDKLGTRLESRG